MMPMGDTQPGMPARVAILKNWHLLVKDFNNCYFNIPLHLANCQSFVFNVPSLNLREPYKRYQWVLLPQGMANSPTMCQDSFSQAIEPVRQKYCQLLVAPKEKLLLSAFGDLQNNLEFAGLQIASEKVHKEFPLLYLGHCLLHNGVHPEKISLSWMPFKLKIVFKSF